MIFEGFGPEQFRRSEDVSRETMANLEVLARLLVKWNRTARLVAPSTLGQIWCRHILDSAQLLDHVPGNARKLADIGTGGGFPGLVLAIIGAERLPKTRFILVDSNARKCEFLREVCRQTGVHATVLQNRNEELDPLEADVVTARAVARLGNLLGMAERHLATGGICMFHKGHGFGNEIRAAARNWRFQFEALPSRTNDGGRILLVRDVTHV